jgi:ATP-dependent helicase HrpB
VPDPDSLDWLDPPPEAALSQAKALLVQLGAIDQQGSISPDGLAMARLPVHPRVAHLIVRGRASGQGPLVAELAAVLGERDLIGRGSGREQPDVDLRLRLDAIRGDPLPLGIEVDRGAVERLRREVREWRRRLGVPGGKPDSSLVGELLSLAYPDRLAQKRPGQAGRYLLRNGRGAWFPPDQPLAREEFLVAVELDDAGSESRIWLAAPIGAERVTRLAAEQGARRELVEWDDGAARVRAVERLELGALVLSERPATDPDPARIRQVFLAALRRLGPGALPWTNRAVSVRQRLAFVHRLEPERWPDPSDAALLEKLEPWIGDRLEGFSRLADLAERVDLGQALVAALSAEQRRALDRLAPERFETPAGSSLEIDYADPVAPSVEVRIQELFGLAQTPTVGGGRVPLTLVLLSPARRPVQITRDLAGFWRTSYQDVRKDLKGRYPKHQWPEHPLDAAPTRRAKPRR